MQWIKVTTERGLNGEPIKEELVNPLAIKRISPVFDRPEICTIIFRKSSNEEYETDDDLVVFHTFDEIQAALRYAGQSIIGMDSLTEFFKEPNDEAQTPNL